MAAGNSEATFIDITLLREKEIVLDLSDVSRDFECEFVVKALVFPSDITDLYKNDFAGILMPLSNRFKEPQMFIEKLIGCDWVEQDELTDDTYGEYKTFTAQPTWLYYKLQWRLVHAAFGIGCYRIRQDFKDIVDDTEFVSFSFRYDVRLFNEDFADRTIKFTYTQNGGKIGDIFDDEKILDFKTIVIEREIRLNGFFGFESGDSEREAVRYETGEEVESVDKHIERFICPVKSIPYFMHRMLKIDILQSWDLQISDYNKTNVFRFYDHKKIKPLGGYEPTWSRNNSYAPIQLEFESRFQNFERKTC